MVYDHRGRTAKGADGPIEVRVTIDRKAYYVNTGVKVERSQFVGGVVVNRPGSDSMNKRLVVIYERVEAEVTNCVADGRPIDVAEIRRKVLETRVGVDDWAFLHWIEERIPMLRIAEGTRKHYATTLSKLLEFGGMRSWNDVTVDNILRWDAWLGKQPVVKGRARALMGQTLSDAGVWNHHKNLKRLLGIAERCDVIVKSPYVALRGEFKRGDNPRMEYLTVEEMKKVETVELQNGGHLDTCRNLFIVQMYTGMAYGDLCKFDISQYRQVGGTWVANSERVKTGVAFVGHLLPPVVKVLEQYHYQLPLMSNEKYNEGLKKVGRLAGIETPLHSHLARHTFGTWMLSQGVKLENLQRMMGHKNINMTQRYAKTLAQSVHDEFSKVAEKMQ